MQVIVIMVGAGASRLLFPDAPHQPYITNGPASEPDLRLVPAPALLP